MWALLKFQARVWIKSPSNMFGFLMPALFMTIMAPMASENITTVVANVITINMISAGLMAFGFTLFEYRKSIIMKRIGSTSISKPFAILSFFAWQTVIALLSIIWTFILGIILGSNVSGYYSSSIEFGAISWGAFFYGILIGILLSLAFGFFFVSISKNIEIFNMLTMLYFFFATFIGGLFFPTSGETGSQYAWMTYIGYIIPHTYVAQFLSASFGQTVVTGIDVSGAVHIFTAAELTAAGGDSGMLPVAALEGLGYTNITVDTVKCSVWDLSNGYDIMKSSIQPLGDSTVIVYSNTNVATWKANLNIFIPLIALGATMGTSLKTFKWDVH